MGKAASAERRPAHETHYWNAPAYAFPILPILCLILFGFAILKIEGRSAFEHELSVENGVFVEFDEQLAQPENLLKIFSRKVRVGGEFADLGASVFHVGTELVCEGENVSGTMSFHVGTQHCPGRLSAR